MSRVVHFEIVRRNRRAKKLVPTLRRCSRQFKQYVAANDANGMTRISKVAWDAMVNLFEVLRNEEDHGNLAAGPMRIPTGFVASSVTLAEQGAMIGRAKLDMSHPTCVPMSLRDALNKVAHYDTAKATYRIDGRGAHYLVLGGKYRGKNWVAEILVSALCKNAAAALDAIV